MKARSQSFSTRTKHSSARKPARSATWTKTAVLRELKRLADPRVRAKIAYFGVDVAKAHGISTPLLHQLEKRIGKSQALAEQLW